MSGRHSTGRRRTRLPRHSWYPQNLRSHFQHKDIFSAIKGEPGWVSGRNQGSVSTLEYLDLCQISASGVHLKEVNALAILGVAADISQNPVMFRAHRLLVWISLRQSW